MGANDTMMGAIGAEYYGQEFYSPPGANGPAGPVEEQLEFAFMQEDDINHPNHYTAGGIEVFDFIQSWGLDFAEGNVIKYVVRGPFKGNRLKDLKKARWYLNKLIERAEQDKS